MIRKSADGRQPWGKIPRPGIKNFFRRICVYNLPAGVLILVSVNAGETVMAAGMDSLSCATNIICRIYGKQKRRKQEGHYGQERLHTETDQQE